MNIHFSIRTDGAYIYKKEGGDSIQFIRFFIQDPGNEHADNYLILGESSASQKQALLSVNQEMTKKGKRISFHYDDNDESEVFWYDGDDWHCMLTLYNRGNSVLLTRTHPLHPKETTEFVFHKFPVEA